MDDLNQDLVDAKIRASEGQMEAKFATLNGRLDLILSSISNSAAEQSARAASVEKDIASLREEVRSSRSTSINVGLGLAALFVALFALVAAMAAFYPAAFGFGLEVREIVQQEVNALAPPNSE